MTTLQCLLEFQNTQDKKTVLDLMRRFSSAMRYAYQRLLEGEKRKDLKKTLPKLFDIDTRYSDDAILLAQSTISSREERQQNPKKLIFGSRKLFEQLKRNHLTGKRRRQLKTKWKENRQGNLYSRGDKSKQGNLNLRFEWIDNELYLRINTGNRQYIYAKVIRDVKRKNDKWIDFIFMLENAYKYKEWFPYSVRLKVKSLPASRHKSWQVLSIALAFCCLERSYRDLSPLKRVIVSKDWTAVANRLVPIPGIGTMTLPKYRLSGSEVSEMADYKYPDPNCAN
jgi:predicted transposase